MHVGNGDAHASGRHRSISSSHVMAPRPEDSEMPILQDRTLGFWLSAGLAGFVWAITPFSWILVLSFLYGKSSYHDYNAFTRFLIGYAFLEVPFSVYYQYLCRAAQRTKPTPAFDAVKMRTLLMECLDVGLSDEKNLPNVSSEQSPSLLEMSKVPEDSATKFRRKLRLWFHNVPLSEIYRDNVKEWLSWALVGSHMDTAQLQEEPNRLLEECVNWIELRVKHKLPRGYNAKAPCIRLTLDPVLILSRPLVYYIVCNGITTATIVWLCSLHGFRREDSHGCTFYVREAPYKGPESKNFQMPVIFLHGLGIGLAQYFAFLKHLTLSNQPVIILTQPAISTSIWHPNFLSPPEPVDHAKAITEVATRMGISKATVISHSNGTMVHSWLLRYNSKLCARNVLVDPVCFRLWEGDVCFNFLHKRWSTGLEVLLGYFVAREIGTAHSIGRDFVWYDMIMWIREIPSPSPKTFHVVLGGKDILIDSVGIVQYLRQCNIDDQCITFCQDYNHGKALIVNSYGMQQVLKQL